MKSTWIETYQNSFSDLIDSNAQIEVVASGHQFTEGPVWDTSNHRLLFSDIPANTVYVWSEDKGVQPYLQPSRFANGLAFDHAGRLIVCEHQARAIASIDTEQVRRVLADTFAGFKLNSPNDVIVARDDSILFSDPIYGLREGNGGPAQQELPFQGVYRYNPHDGLLTLITDTFERPNGLAFSPDQKQLFIADTVKQHVRVFSVDNDWSFSGGDVWVELWDANHSGRPDGMKFDAYGNLFAVGPGGIWVFSADAVLLGRIFLPDKTSNLAWGEGDRKSLFITSSDKVYRLRTRTAGLEM